MNRGHVKNGDVLLYKDGGKPGEHPGKKSLVDCDFPFKECCINEHVYRVRVRHPLTQHFLYFWLDTPYVTDQIIQRAVGVAQPGLNRDAVQSLPILVPSSEIVLAFDRKVRPLCTLVFENCKESRTLAELRDALLPKLLFGEVRVQDAEQVISAAV
jgi:type I restriction enzyme, S subunit